MTDAERTYGYSDEDEEITEEVRTFMCDLVARLCPRCLGQGKADILPIDVLVPMRLKAFKRWQAGPDCPVCGGTGKAQE